MLRRGLDKAILHATRQRVLSQAREPSLSKLAVPVARNDGNTGHSATSALDNHATFYIFFFLNQQSEYKVIYELQRGDLVSSITVD